MPAAPASPPSDAPSLAGRPTVCLVEDHDVLRGAMTDLLTSRGARVVAAVGSVAQGFDAIVALRPAIAVIDNQLPDGRGVDLCGRLASVAPSVSLVLHSGTVSEELRREARSAGVAAVVTKSIRGEELVAAIESIVASGANGQSQQRG